MSSEEQFLYDILIKSIIKSEAIQLTMKLDYMLLKVIIAWARFQSY